MSIFLPSRETLWLSELVLLLLGQFSNFLFYLSLKTDQGRAATQTTGK